MSQPSIDQLFQLGLNHHQSGQLAQAEQFYRQVLALQPEHPDALHLLGVIAHKIGRHDLAVDLIRKAIACNPRHPTAHLSLARALRDMGQLDAAIDACRQAIAVHPDMVEAHGDLGAALREKGLVEEAILAFRKAIALQPGYALAYYNLGNALRDQGQLDAAIDAFRHAISLTSQVPEAFNNLGIALITEGEFDAALDAYRQALALFPDHVRIHSNLVYHLHFHPASDPQAIAAECRRWNRLHAEPLARFIQPHPNDRHPARRLRVGFVSPDFRNHPVGRFLWPLLAHHDQTQVEIFGYAQVSVPDEITHQLQACTDGWHNIVGLSDAQVADQIRHDRIDILVDLTMHMAAHRLLVFARKPAPVQVTYLAYCASTGLSTMDYRLSDPHLDPPGMDESVYTERTVRLPETYWCYQPWIAGLDVGPLPARARGGITFGSFNIFCKVNAPLLTLWARILRAVPDSHLLIHAQEGSHRQRTLRQLHAEGIAPERIRFFGYLPSAEYFRLYREIDVALDTSPYGGGTTTCDALWMGVPVVSLIGPTALGRGGLSILSNIGLPELAAPTPDDYVRIASDLAHDWPRLDHLRSTLRARMSQSPLMDAPRFARHFQAALRQMWRHWCVT